MAKTRKMETSPVRRRVVEETEEVEFMEEEGSETLARRAGERYAKSDLDKIRKIHFLVTQLSHYLGVPSAPSFAFQPSQATLQSGYSFSPMGYEPAIGQGQPMGMSSGLPAGGGSSPFSPGVSPQTVYLTPYSPWNLFQG